MDYVKKAPWKRRLFSFEEQGGRFVYNEWIKKKLTTVKMALKRLILYLQWGKGRVKFTHNRLKGEATLLKKERKLWKEKALSPTLAS